MSENQPDVKIKEGSSKEDMAQSIRAIEGLFHAINDASFKLAHYQSVMMGMSFLNAVHASLLKELGPEEVERIRKSEAFKNGDNAPKGAA